jgi:hypothetical protein
VYAAWFKGRLEAYPRRLCSLGNNHAVFNSLKDSAAEAGSGEFPQYAITELPVENPVEIASRSLIGALSDPRSSAALGGELQDLLFPDNPHPALGDLIEAVRDLSKPYYEGAVNG